MTRFRLAALSLAAFSVLVTAGCSDDGDAGPAPGSDGDDRAAAEVLDDAADATLGSRQFGVTAETTLQIAGQNLNLTAEGRVDYDATVADVSLALDQDGESQEVRILSDGETAWVSGEGGVVPEFPEGATYVAGDAALLAEDDTFEPEDLIGVVIVLRSAEDVEEGETEEIDGVETREYSFTTVYRDAVEAAGEDAEAFQSALSLTGDAEESELDVDVWVGPDDVVRRLELEIRGGDNPVGGTYDLELSDVGDDVDPPDAPADDEVATGPEAEALFEQLLA